MPFDETQFNGDFVAPAIMNSLYFLVLAFVGGFFLVFLLRRNRRALIRLLFGVSLWLSGTILLWVFFDAFLLLLHLPPVSEISILLPPASGGLALLLTYAAIKLPVGHWERNLSIIVYGGIVGTFLGANVPTLTLIAILSVTSLYDIYGVFRGPIKELMGDAEVSPPVPGGSPQPDHESLPLLTYATPNWEIGIGDLAFYSMFTSHVLVLFGVPLFFVVGLAISLGALGTLSLLRSHPLLPGLPLSIGSGLMVLFLYLALRLLLPGLP